MIKLITALDSCAIVIAIALLFISIVKNITKLISSKTYLIELILIIISSILEIETFRFVRNELAFCILTTIIYLIKCQLVIIMSLYIIQITHVNRRFNKFYLIAYSIPFIVALIFLILNPFLHTLFEFKFDQFNNLIFNTNYGMYIVSSILLFYSLLDAYYIIKTYKYVSTPAKISLTIFVLILIFDPLYQMIFNLFPAKLLTFSVGLLFISFTIENTEILLDNTTGLISERRAIYDLKLDYEFKINKYYVVLKIINFNELYQSFGFSLGKKNIKSIATKIISLFNKTLHDDEEIYYLGNGMILITTFSKDVASMVSTTLINEGKLYKFDKEMFNPQFKALIIKRSDFYSFDELKDIVDLWRIDDPFIEDITVYNKIKNDMKYQMLIEIDDIVVNSLTNNELVPYFQPIYSPKYKDVVALEVLARIESKKFGIIESIKFIDISKKNNVITKIDLKILEETFKIYNEYKLEFKNIKRIGINIANESISDKAFINKAVELFKQYKMPRNLVNFEISEAIDAASDDIMKNMMYLNYNGYNFTVDDYGTGYSNVKNFALLQIDTFKIDRSITENIGKKNVDKLFHHLYLLSKYQKRNICVEGVNKKEQIDFLKSISNDIFIQGNYISYPLSKDGLIKSFKEGFKEY